MFYLGLVPVRLPDLFDEICRSGTMLKPLELFRSGLVKLVGTYFEVYMGIAKARA